MEGLSVLPNHQAAGAAALAGPLAKENDVYWLLCAWGFFPPRSSIRMTDSGRGREQST